MENGYFRLGRFGGAPIRIHWSAPLGAFFFGGFRFAPLFWLAFVILILVHEIGHAAFVRAFRLQIVAVDVHGIGGECRWVGNPTPVRRSLIAWGGVAGQAVLAAIAFPLMYLLPAGTPRWLFELVSAFTYTNLYLMAINLLPIPGFDGAEAWKLFGANGLRAWWRQRSLRKGKARSVVRSMPVHRPFSADDILEKTPPHQKRPPPHMLN